MSENNNPTPITNIDTRNVLFVSDLPKEVIEEDLLNFFKNYNFLSAKIHKNKISTFAYVHLNKSSDAEKARKELNGEIFTAKYSDSKTGKPIRICKYLPKSQLLDGANDSSKSLLVKNIDKTISGREFYSIMEKFGDVESCKLEVDEAGNSKGYGYVYFSDEKASEAAKLNLNGKEFNGKQFDIVNLIPTRSRENIRNNIFVKNIPRDFSDEEFKKLFSKYGKITSATLSRDINGVNKGFGIVSFDNALHAIEAIKDLREKNLSFPGLQPLYVDFVMKKQELISSHKKKQDFNNTKMTGQDKFLAMPMDMNLFSKNVEEFENEVRCFIKVILISEYFPKNIQINMSNRSAIVTMNSSKDMDEFNQKYVDYITKKFPNFAVFPFTEPMENTQNFQVNQLNPIQTTSHQLMNNQQSLINQFQNLKLNTEMNYPGMSQKIINPVNMMPTHMPLPSHMHQPTHMPLPMPMQMQMNMSTAFSLPNKFMSSAMPQKFSQNLIQSHIDSHSINQKQNQNYSNNSTLGYQNYFSNIKKTGNVKDDPVLVEETAALIYEVAEQFYPDEAGKITGMIIDLGLEEMKAFLLHKEKLKKVITEAHNLLHS